MPSSLSKKVILLVALPLAFELVFVSTLAFMLHTVQEERAKENYARDLTAHVNNALTALLDRFSSCILYHVSDSPAFRRRFDESRRRIEAEIKYLHNAVDDPAHTEERALVYNVETLLQRCIENLQRAQGQLELGNKILAARQWMEADRNIGALLKAIDEIVVAQEQQLKLRKAAQESYIKATELTLIAGVVFNVALALGLAIYFNRGTIRRLKTVTENSLRLALDKPLSDPVGGDDEIALLDTSFRQMALALAESRRKERAVVDNANDVICCIGRDGTFIEANPACAQLWGYEPEELLGRNLKELLPQVQSETVKTTVQMEAIATDPSHSGGFENTIVTRSGKHVDFSWSMHWSSADRMMFCVARDITERKEIDRMKRDFVAMVSHDLRTPLTSIQMVLSLFAAEAYGQVSDAGHENLEAAEANIARLISLVNGLLDLEKMEDGKLELLRETVSISELFSTTLGALRGFAEQQGVKIEVAIAQDAKLFADRDRIVQVLINLLSNAIKFSSKPGTVRLGAQQEESCVRFLIVDHGRGIPADMREAVFERFHQVDATDQKKQHGSGLGLSICKAIVERHGGKIGVESKDGQGSTFWFTLPL